MISRPLPRMIILPPQHRAYDYAERICGRLPCRLQAARLVVRLKPYALAIHAGVSRDMIGDIEHGNSIPTLFFAAQLAFGLGITLAQLIGPLEDACQ